MEQNTTHLFVEFIRGASKDQVQKLLDEIEKSEDKEMVELIKILKSLVG